jgi:hypothetical protein
MSGLDLVDVSANASSEFLVVRGEFGITLEVHRLASVEIDDTYRERKLIR